MIFYVAIAYFNYAGLDVIGIFDSRKAAQNACDNHKDKDGSLIGDGRIIQEYKLNEAIGVEI